REGVVSAARRQQLDAIGFVWNAIESAWEKGFAALTTFKAREGHCKVPARYIEGSFNLGVWVITQRVNRATMSAERRKRLDDIGFVWKAIESAWEKGFAALTTFKAREGHCKVPRNHIEGTFKLGEWVITQRVNGATMSAERRKRLDDIGFV